MYNISDNNTQSTANNIESLNFLIVFYFSGMNIEKNPIIAVTVKNIITPVLSYSMRFSILIKHNTINKLIRNTPSPIKFLIFIVFSFSH